MNLFENDAPAAPDKQAPLAARMRPRTLDEIVGQKSLMGPGKPLRQAIERDRLTSAVFFGPPGCGKSTVAAVIARHTAAHFENFSAVTGGVAEVRKLIEAARERRRAYGHRTLLFVDEIHRFNKAQQDAFLPHVEDGTVLLIGATTENPYFSVNAPLLSRARIYRFEPLTADDIGAVLDRALSDPERGLGGENVTLDADARAHLMDTSNGDARGALNALELAASLAATALTPPTFGGSLPSPNSGRGGTVTEATSSVRGAAEADAVSGTPLPELGEAGTREAGGGVRAVITLAVAEEAIGRRAIGYDKEGDVHYDIISAFIKSVRGSDPDAAVYYLARMLEAGEDPRFVARRLVILASEDIGNADPSALPLAVAGFHTTEVIGMPECALNLSQVTIYLASAPKSNAATIALGRAQEDVRGQPFPGVPKPLRDSHYRGAKALGHGAGYQYPHDHEGAFVRQRYLPDGLPSESRPYYEPTENGVEARIKARLARLWADPPPGDNNEETTKKDR